MRHLLLLFVILFSSWVPALALSNFPPDMLLDKTYAQRYFYLDIIYDKFLPQEDSITFFNRINELKQLGIQNSDHELELEAELLSLSAFIHNHPKDSAHCLHMFNQLLNTAQKENNTILLARLNNTIANYYFEDLKNYELGFQYYHAEYELIKDMSVDLYPGKQKSIYSLGNCYYFFRDYNNAIKYLTEAYRTNVFGESLYYTLQATNSVGLCHQNLGHLDSADYYFQRANSIAITVGNEAWDGISSGNLGYNQFLRGDYDAAMPLLQKDLDLSVKRNDWGCASGSLIVLAEINLKKGNTTLAQQQAEQAHHWIVQAKQYSRLQALYPLMSKLSGKQGKSDMASLYLDSTIMVKDSLTRKFNALLMLRTIQKEKLQQQEAAVRSQKTWRITIQSAAIFIITILLVILARNIYRLRRNAGVPVSQ